MNELKFIPLEPPLFNYQEEIEKLKMEIIKACAIPPSILGKTYNGELKNIPKFMLLRFLRLLNYIEDKNE